MAEQLKFDFNADQKIAAQGQIGVQEGYQPLFPQRTCHHCGYCPHCGRGGHYTQPWYYGPRWISYPTVTSSTNGYKTDYAQLGNQNLQSLGGQIGGQLGSYTVSNTERY